VTTQTQAVVGAATLPRVNLMPPEIDEKRRFRQLQLAMGGAVVGAVAVVGLLDVSAQSGVSSAQAKLNAAQAAQTSLQTQLTKLQGVSQTYAQRSAEQAQLVTAMGPEILWSHFLNDLALRIPDHVWITQLTATENSTTQAAAASASQVLTSGIGTVTFAGTAFSHDDVASWLDSLANEKGYANPYFTNSAEALIGPKTVVNFTSAVTLTNAALSGRYLNLAKG